MSEPYLMEKINPDLFLSLEKSVINENGLLRVLPANFWLSFPFPVRRVFMHHHGIYVMPTSELIEWLAQNIIGNAIEIGAGNGAIARTLGIPITDSRMQEDPDVAFYYQQLKQPTIKYPDDVEKLNYTNAIKKYNPDTVIGAYITHKWRDDLQSGNYKGVREEEILKKVKRYINIGNSVTHHDKPIRKLPHTEYYFDWIVTRAQDQKTNKIWVWDM